MKTLAKIFGFISILTILNGCSSGYYSTSNGGGYYPSSYYAPYPTAPYYRGFYPNGNVYYQPVPYNQPHHSPSMSAPSPSHSVNPGMGTPSGGGRRR